MTTTLQPHERPWCDKIAWDLVKEGPAWLESFICLLAERGASPDEIKGCVRLLGLVVVGDQIGHEMDFEETALSRARVA